MSLSVTELDVVTKQFFEGRGEVVGSGEAPDKFFAFLVLTSEPAKASPEYVKSSIYRKTQDHTATQLMCRPVQRESRCLATGGQDFAGSPIPTDQM